MFRRPPRSTLTYPLFPSTPLFRSKEQAVGLRLAIFGQGIVRGLVEIDRKTRIDIIEIHLGIVRDDQNIDSLLIHLGQAYMRIRRAPEKLFDRRALADQFFVNAGGDGYQLRKS